MDDPYKSSDIDYSHLQNVTIGGEELYKKPSKEVKETKRKKRERMYLHASQRELKNKTVIPADES